MEIFYNAFSTWTPMQVYTIVIARRRENDDVAMFIRTKSQPEIPEKDSWTIVGEIPLEWNPWGIIPSRNGETNLLISLIALFASNPFVPITTSAGKEFIEALLTQELKNTLGHEKYESSAPSDRSNRYSSEYISDVIGASVRQAFRSILKEARRMINAQETTA